MPIMLGSRPGNLHEQIVYKALASQLPDDWLVVSNVSWSQRENAGGGNSYVRDGQADFVVLAPGLGLLVLEVKGSRFIKVADDGRWYRSRDKQVWELVEKETPQEQATGNAHKLARTLAQNFRTGTFRHPYGYIVVFPRGEIAEGNLSMFDPSTLVLKPHMGDLRGRIRTALQARATEGRAREFTSELATEMAGSLVSQGLLIAPASDEEVTTAVADSRKIEVLTRQQAAALEGIFRYPRVAVTGPAGTGKTVLAMWRLASLLEQGKNAVYLCYNTSLAEFQRIRHPECAAGIHSVDRYFASLARHVSRRDAVGDSAFYGEELPGHVLDTVSDWPDERKLDAVIIDEGQDFGELRIWATQELIRPDGDYLYCADDRQNLYDRKARDAISAEVIFSLVHNCRNTVRINETSNLVLNEHVPSMPGLPIGIDSDIHLCADAESMTRTAWRLAMRWSEGNARVVILSPFKFENSSMAQRPTWQSRRLVQSIAEWEGGQGVLFSTIKSFKGLEADAVIVVDVDLPRERSPIERADLYVACTRGRARLALLCSSKAAVQHFSPTRAAAK